MSAVLRDPGAPQRQIHPMTVADLDAVMAIEHSAYPVPWSRGNFIDSLAAGYHALLLHSEEGHLLGYLVAMDGVQEMHLLNLTVAPAQQNQGHGRHLLGALRALCHERGAHTLWLEVRHSNQRARALYEREGFIEVGLRRAYYPQASGTPGREDAVVMYLPLHLPLQHLPLSPGADDALV
jgi:[ribosomal protein S18]-alanine N-acetyltransferase